MTPGIRRLRPEDRAAWEPLARAYKAFYATPTSDEELEQAWQRVVADREVHGFGAWHGERMVGLAHYLFHSNAWAPRACYLQDLFTVPEARGRGVARALIAAVADDARRRGATRYYWLTQENNKVARALYDKVAEFKGFIRYDHPL